MNSLELSQFQKQFDFSINGAYHSFISDLFSFQKSGDLYYSMTAASICIPFLEAFLGEWIREHHKVNVEPVQTNTTTAPRIPRRMTELLDMPQLKEILSPIMLLIIKISIGPPPGLNIRNLLWHGFLSDGEFQIEITSLLILLICQLLHQNRSTFGHLSVIKKKNIQEWIDKLKFSVSCNIFGEGREGELNSIEPLLNKSFFIIPSQKSQWRLAFSFLKKQENYLSTIVLIPLLEHSIRRVFAVSNECGSRVLTARVHSLMTTMDTLLDDFIETTPNLIFNEFGQNIMHILHDLFIAKQGPRIRDLIAHGVVEETTIPTYFSNCLAALAIYLCLKYDVDNNGLKDYFKIYNSDLLERVVDFVENYKPLFHPKSYQLRTVNEIYKRWIVLQNLCNEPDITPEPLTPEMIHYRDSFISCLEHPYFATNSNEKDYEYSFDVTMGKDQSRVLVLVSKIQERILKIIEELISSYETLKQRIEGFNSSKSQRQNFFLLQRNISHFSWFIQFSMISLEAILHTQKHDLIDQLLEWLEQYGKAMGLVHTRISKNEYAATKEMFELIVGQDDQNMKLVSSREKKLIAGTAPLLEKIFLPPKE
uniref:DUF4209 domain-containing protein n=1 Tax=Arcella intermedia TaxID=1963864 RepID=A0A6B2L093_9EUKA